MTNVAETHSKKKEKIKTIKLANETCTISLLWQLVWTW